MSFVELSPTLSSLQTMVKPFYMDDSIPCIRLTLNGIPRYSEHYNFVQTKRLELMRTEIRNYPKLHMLTDSRTAGPVLDDDVNYFKDIVLSEMEKAGIRYLAIVMPSNKFTQLTIRDMTKETRLMTVKYFESMREARHWLRKMTVA
jgi:hypothetical protein